ncbi:hypothetical protein ACP275_06G092700 [Erythranthe tilingii]
MSISTTAAIQKYEKRKGGNMFGTMWLEREVKVPASGVWKIYGTLKLANIFVRTIPSLVSKIDVLQGNGGAGTIVELFLHPGKRGSSSYKEKFTVVDDEKRVKVVEVLEGGYLDLGFTLYRVRFEVIEKDETECIVRATIECEVREEYSANADLVSTQRLGVVMEAAALHLIQTYDNQS